MLAILKSHFEHSEGSTTEDGSQEGVREADLSEVMLTTSCIAIKWQNYWRSHGGHKNPYKAEAVNAMFFHPFLAANETKDALK